jgi:predicted TIM-barrel fold metal-dependent hydrolase
VTESRRLTGIIDVHAHSVLPSWYAVMSEKSRPNPPRIESVPIPQWSAEGAVETMDQNGIQAMVLSNPTGTKDLIREEAIALARRMNEELAEVLRKHPKRFGAFAVLPLQDMDATLAELEYALDQLGFDGVCLQTSFEGAYPGHPRFEPLFAELNRRRTVAFVHPVGAAYLDKIDLPFINGLLEFVFDSTRAVTSLVYSGMRQRYPDFTYIATHGGGTIPFLAHRISYIATRHGTGYRGTMAYEEVRAGLQSLHYDLTASTKPGSLSSLLDLVPPTQLLLGFDYPMMKAQMIAPAVESLLESNLLDDSGLRAIARENAFRIMPRLAKRLGGPSPA